eukprot:8677986-Alexandrium_andersonii.AAC.1
MVVVVVVVARDDPCRDIVGMPWRWAKRSHARDQVGWLQADSRREDLGEDVASAASAQKELTGEL